MNAQLGTIEARDDRFRLTLVRRLTAKIEAVWAALVEPAQLAEWLGDVRRENLYSGQGENIFFSGIPTSAIPGVLPPTDPDVAKNPDSPFRRAVACPRSPDRVRWVYRKQAGHLAGGSGRWELPSPPRGRKVLPGTSATHCLPST